MRLFLPLAILLVSIQTLAQTGPADYFPLKVGDKWTYNWMPTNNTDNEQVVRIDDFDEEYNAYLVTTILKVGDALPVTSQDFFEFRKDKVLKLGTRGGLFNADWQFESGQVMLQYPLKLNSAWKGKENGDAVDYRVVGFVDLTVPAGTFNNVCKVEAIVHEKDIHNKRRTIVVETDFLYYDSAVGLIKEESSLAKSLGGDGVPQTVLELTKYKMQ